MTAMDGSLSFAIYIPLGLFKYRRAKFRSYTISGEL